MIKRSFSIVCITITLITTGTGCQGKGGEALTQVAAKLVSAASANFKPETKTQVTTTDSVEQQKAAHLAVLIDILGLAAKASGASDADIQKAKSETSQDKIKADTVYKQVSVYARGSLLMAGVAAKAAGASETDVQNLLSQTLLKVQSFATSPEQTATFLSALVNMMGMLAQAKGASDSAIQSVNSVVSSTHATAAPDNIALQTALSAKRFMLMTGGAARVAGASESEVLKVASDASVDEKLADTIHKKIVAYLKASIDMVGLLATAK
ncbi:MAG: hypothetical protein ACAI44_08245 [Candidatus Sericytochromatia bacterium]